MLARHEFYEKMFSLGRAERHSGRYSAQTLVTIAASFTIRSATAVDRKKTSVKD
jgi:hypothetical protein